MPMGICINSVSSRLGPPAIHKFSREIVTLSGCEAGVTAALDEGEGAEGGVAMG